ncbi:MAG: ATP-dependent ligase [Rhodoglobus sp.]|nr:ATP-dependent ligase [Rhodoglobus sp.]
MGTLLYGSPPSEVTMEDRLLAHLKVVIIQKMRRNESFLISWELPTAEGSGRMSLWMHPSIPLQFKFAGSRPPTLNPDWLDALARASMSVDGLRITPEPVGLAQPITAPVVLPSAAESLSHARVSMPSW